MMMHNLIDQFRNAIQASGMTTPETIYPDGKRHRFASNGKDNDDAGWYALHLDGFPEGIYGDWRTGITQTWKADTGRQLSLTEVQAFKTKLENLRKIWEEEEQRGHDGAAHKARLLWGTAKSATAAHTYLQRKGIQPYGTRIDRDGWLLVPMRNAIDKLWNVERIAPDKTATEDAKMPRRCRRYRTKLLGTFGTFGGIFVCGREFLTMAAINQRLRGE